MTHTTLGRDAIQRAEDQLGFPVDFSAPGQGDRLQPSGEVGWQRVVLRASGDDIPISCG